MTNQSIAFLDESGGLDTPSFVLGGFVAHAETWDAFTVDWQAVLDLEPRLPPFHAVEFEHHRNGFHAMEDKRLRAMRLSALVEVVMKHRPQPVICIVGMDDFKDRMPGRRRGGDEQWKYPYQYAALNLVGSLCMLHEEMKFDFGSIDVVLDHTEQFGSDTALKVESDVRASLASRNPEIVSRLGDVRWPVPTERINHVPLQAADLLVWHQRRALDKPDGRHRRAFKRLRQLPIRYIQSPDGFDSLGYWRAGHEQPPSRG